MRIVKRFDIMYFIIVMAVLAVIISSPLYAVEDPSDWTIRKDLLINSNGEARNDLIHSLFNKLESNDEPGERVTRQEFLKLLDHPDVSKIYKDMLIKYATPKSFTIQETEHKNVTKAFMKPKMLKEGVKFLKKHSRILNKVEKEYGVYKEDIVSILMWETSLGKYTGNYRVFNIFLDQILFLDAAQEYCLAEMIKEGKEDPFGDNDFKTLELRRISKRKMYAVESLAALVRHCKKYNMDPLSQKGSWGGAIGYAQFMPFNLKYVIDADKNGKADLFNWTDAFYSIGNYLKLKGNYTKTLKGRKEALFDYNRSDEYVNGVMLYADTISKKAGT